MVELEETIKELKNGILNEVPQVPFIIDQIDYAIQWCLDAHDESTAIKVLKISLEVAKYVKSISDPNFYKTHLLIASLISDIEGVKEDEKFSRFKTASGAVEKTLDAVMVNKDLITNRGCFNALNIWLTNLAATNEEAFTVMLYGILIDLKEVTEGLRDVSIKSPITPEDYVQVLGYAYVMANLRMANLRLLESTRLLINQIEIILNNDVIF